MIQKRFSRAGDRRDYFRIDDLSIIRYAIIENSIHPHESDILYQQRKKRLTLKAKLDSLTREMQPIHKMIASGNAKVAKYLAMIDRKLEMISDCLVYNELNTENNCLVPVNLGAGGISFDNKSPIMSGSMLELEIVLLPENTAIFSAARVVTCVKDESSTTDDNHYRISVEFIDMEENVRDLISRHVITREIKEVTNVQDK